jgi:hypothetical protein
MIDWDQTNLFERNRYDSSAAVKAFDSSRTSKGVVSIREGRFSLFEVDYEIDGEKLEIYFSPPGEVPEERIQFARDVCVHLTEFDNLVQQSCEREFEASPPNDSYLEYLRRFKLPAQAAHAVHLAYLIVDNNVVKLHYYGTFVNAEWDAIFQRGDTGRWQKVNF